MTHEERRKRRAEMAQAVKAGEPLDVICARFGVTLPTLYTSCRESGVTPPAKTETGQFDVLAALLERKEPGAIAVTMGVSLSYVYRVRSRADAAGIRLPPLPRENRQAKFA